MTEPINIRDTLFGDMPLEKWSGEEGQSWKLFQQAKQQLEANDKTAAVETVSVSSSCAIRASTIPVMSGGGAGYGSARRSALRSREEVIGLPFQSTTFRNRSSGAREDGAWREREMS